MRSPTSSYPEPIVPRVFSGVACVKAGFSRRYGGVSEGPYRSLNLSLSTGDEESRVEENRRRFFEAQGIGPHRLAIAGQVHGSSIEVVTEPGLYPDRDALVATVSHVALCIVAADCAVVLLVDARSPVVAACHSGWRGTVDNIAGKTVRKMVEYGADASAIRAWVSPCISIEHFEVGPEVAARFAKKYVVRRDRWPRPHVDLKAAIADQLGRAGIPQTQIEVSDRCTAAETDTFFSHRAEQGTTGRMMGYIMLT
ncbi:MAG: peptidoglycan editing factor PgeF [Rhodothermales bacterium]